MSDLKKTYTKPNQTIWDIAIQEYGSVESVFEILQTNKIDLNTQLNEAEQLLINISNQNNNKIINFFKNSKSPASLTQTILNFPLPVVVNPEVIISNGGINTFTLNGAYFDQYSNVSISGESVVDSVQFINSNTLVVNVIVGSVSGNFDLTVTNQSGSNTFSIVKVQNWVDLRSGGEILSIGNTQNNDIRHNSSLSVFRDSLGLGVTNASSQWQDWLKFEFLNFHRGDNKTIQFIVRNFQTTVMAGVGSTATDETSTLQFSQMETVLYFRDYGIIGLFGNDGTIGVLSSQQLKFNYTWNSNKNYKIVITNDGSQNSIITMYELPDFLKQNWDDESNPIYTITSNLTPNEINLMPVFLPRKLGVNGRIVSVKTN